MIKAVFLDWFNTLAHFEPPRHQLYRQALLESGIEISPEKIMRSILLADQYFFEENAKSPVEKRSPEEQTKVYLHYPNSILAEARVEAPRELPLQILKTVMQQFKGGAFALFDDVLSTLQAFKQQDIILGLITNLNRDVTSICRKLGLQPYLDFVVTPQEAGADKPQPAIFLAALDRARVDADQAVHVGDQYQVDVVGARGVGITPILIDRYDIPPEVSDCRRIHSLTELVQHL